jgi:hypothetical protein
MELVESDISNHETLFYFTYKTLLCTLRYEGSNHSESNSMSLGAMSTPFDAPVEIVEKREQIETKLEEYFLLVSFQCPEYFCRVVHVILVEDSAKNHQRDPVKQNTARTCSHYRPQEVHSEAVPSIAQITGNIELGTRVRRSPEGQTTPTV